MRKHYIEPEPLFLTSEKIAEIKSELEHIEKTLMPSIRKRLAEAYEDGDMPENNPWLTANDELQSSMKRRNELRHLLLRSKKHQTTPDHNTEATTMGIGRAITISINNAAPQTITLVASEEADPQNNKISVDSPLGKALMQNLEETFELETPGGKVTITRFFE